MKPILLVAAFLVTAVAHAQPRAWSGASWVWDRPDANANAQTDDPRYLRRTFDLPAAAQRAELAVTADNAYVAYVNGQKVGADDEWQTVERYDVTRFLKAGKNVLALEAINGGGPAGIIARLQIKTADGKTVVVGTDAKTRIAQSPARGWQQLAFDDASWQPAVVLGDAGIGPWSVGGTVAGGGKGDVSAADGKIKGRLSAEEQLKHFVVPKDFKIELVAADPLVINPVTIAVDDNGRIYVSESHTYRYGPSGSPIKPFANPVVRLGEYADGTVHRTLIADGFDDPVMGITVKGNKLWLTSNNFLYTYDLTPRGKATNKKTLLVDKNKAWNPFGMFVLEWGPDGLLYMSVGDHKIDIHGPDGKISGRGNSGIVMRMQPDGMKMERLVHGLRVPYSFEMDPFGQLWVLSNGEGNPNRFIRVIDGVDYHCYSRGGVDNAWLAGNHPLAPPTFETPRGAHTQIMRYYGAAYPKEYQGNLLLCNWGAHGFAGPNRAIFRYVPDDAGKIDVKEPLVSCTDPHFRPSHIALDGDGNLLIADWYGRDDESDMTGRIWRLRYTGKGTADKNETLDIARGLWRQFQKGTPEADDALADGAKHAAEAKVRRLSMNLLRRREASEAQARQLKQPYDFDALTGASTPLGRLKEAAAKYLAKDGDPAVRVEAALAFAKATERRSALVAALKDGAAENEFTRYEAAWHLAKVADKAAFETLLAADDANLRLAGLIALDVACFEGFDTKPIALAVLGDALQHPGKADLNLLLTLAQLNGDKSLTPALETLIGRDDLPLAVTAKAIVVLKAKGGLSAALNARAGKRLIEAVEKGAIRVQTTADQLMLLEFLAAEGPSDFALKQVGARLRGGDPQVRDAAHVLARRFGTKAAPLVAVLWPAVLDPRTKHAEALEDLATLARVEDAPNSANWHRLLTGSDPLLRTEAVRWWRTFQGQPKLVEMLERQRADLVKSDPALQDDLDTVWLHLEAKTPPTRDKDALTKETRAVLEALPTSEKARHAMLGKQVFERAACTKCHTTAMQTTLLAPSLKGVGGQKIDYLIESVLSPSKIIKTGFESEMVALKDGRVLNGLVKDEGKTLRVLSLDRDERVAKADVEQRALQRVSIMPAGQEATLSRREFVDLIAYLATLR